MNPKNWGLNCRLLLLLLLLIILLILIQIDTTLKIQREFATLKSQIRSRWYLNLIGDWQERDGEQMGQEMGLIASLCLNLPGLHTSYSFFLVAFFKLFFPKELLSLFFLFEGLFS